MCAQRSQFKLLRCCCYCCIASERNFSGCLSAVRRYVLDDNLLGFKNGIVRIDIPLRIYAKLNFDSMNLADALAQRLSPVKEGMFSLNLHTLRILAVVLILTGAMTTLLVQMGSIAMTV